MPIYEYACSKCGKHHEIMQRITEAPLTICPKCGGQMKKLISSTSFVLKGTGWYATDYGSRKKKEGAEHKEGEKKEKKPLDLKSELKKEKKTEKKTDSKGTKSSKE